MRLVLRTVGSRRAVGFSLLELLVVVSISTIVMAAALPQISGVRRRLELNAAAHDVMAAIQGARLRSVATGRTLRVRFNCPANGQYRVVEMVGDPAVDGAANRCDGAAYPFPDPNPNIRPNLDGPILRLRGGVSFGAVVNLDVASNGRFTPWTGATPATLTVVNFNATRSVSVSNSGRLVLQ
jgi:prepilin-type N-terminal cleavage/methylation domain-containing protein